MSPMMMLCYMYILCKREPLVMAITSKIKYDDIGWIGLFGGKELLIQDSNEFLTRHLVVEK